MIARMRWIARYRITPTLLSLSPVSPAIWRLRHARRKFQRQQFAFALFQPRQRRQRLSRVFQLTNASSGRGKWSGSLLRLRSRPPARAACAFQWLAPVLRAMVNSQVLKAALLAS